MDSSSASPILGNPVVLSVTGLLSGRDHGRDQDSSTESSHLVTMAGLTVDRARCCVQDQAQLPSSEAMHGRFRILARRNVAKAMEARGRTSGPVATERDGNLASSVNTGEICRNPEMLAAHQGKANCPSGPSLHGAECRPGDMQPGPAGDGDVVAQTRPPDAATACTSQTCVTDFRKNISTADGNGVEASTVASAADAPPTAASTMPATARDEDGDTQPGAIASVDASSTAALTTVVSAVVEDEDGDTQPGAVASANTSSTETSTVSASAEDATVVPVKADASSSTVLTAAGNAQAGSTVSPDWCGAVLWGRFKTAMSSLGQLINRLIGNLLALFTCARNTGDNSVSGGDPEHSSPAAPSDASGEVNRPARDGASASPQGHIEARGATAASGIQDQYLSRVRAIMARVKNNPDFRKVSPGLKTSLNKLLSLLLRVVSFDSIANTLIFHEELSQQLRCRINDCQELLNGWLAKFPESERDLAATHIIINAVRARLKHDGQAARTLMKLLPVLSEHHNKNRTQKVEMTFPDLEVKIDCSLNAIKEGIEIGVMLCQNH